MIFWNEINNIQNEAAVLNWGLRQLNYYLIQLVSDKSKIDFIN
jgi:hypothetical protein